MRGRFLLLTIILASAASALTIADFSVTAGINGNSLEQSVNITLLNDGPAQNWSIDPGPGTVSSLTGAKLAGGKLAGTLEKSASATVSYSLKDQLAASDSGRVFLRNFQFDQPVERFSYALDLPPGVVVEDAFPAPAFRSDGRMIILEWTAANLTAGQKLSLNADLRQAAVELKTFVPVALYQPEWFIPGVILVFIFGYFLGAGAGAWLLQRVFPHVKPQLSEEEQRIVDFLANGPTTQATIQQQLGFSKAKLSRVLRSMEERKILEKQAKGRTNLVRLK
jgi:hypothetical protein